MINLNGNTQLVLTTKESMFLKQEISKAFIELDTEVNLSQFSGDNMKKKYPLMWELYKMIGGV